MPIPLIIGGAAIVSALIGAVATVGGLNDINEAKEIGRKAEKKYKKHWEGFENRKAEFKKKSEVFSLLKLDAFNYIKDVFVPIYKKYKDVNIRNCDIEQYENIALTPINFKEFEIQATSFIETAGGLMKAASTGAGASFGALGLSGWVGTASTGTAISSLSGAAASKATLAWLGGGALKAGGYGILGGKILLGTVAIGPALALGGFILAIKGDKALTCANKYAADVDKSCADIDCQIELIKAVHKRTAEMEDVVNKVVMRFKGSVNKLKKLNKPPNKLTDRDIAEIMISRFFAGALKMLLEVPVVCKSGKPSQESKRAISKVKKTKHFLGENYAKY